MNFFIQQKICFLLLLGMKFYYNNLFVYFGTWKEILYPRKHKKLLAILKATNFHVFVHILLNIQFCSNVFYHKFLPLQAKWISNVPTPDIDVHFRHSLLSLFVIIIMFAFSFYIKELLNALSMTFYLFWLITIALDILE